jgi:rhamnosyltransferase subunit B
MHFLLCPMGTSGDMHPFLGMGRELARRGHRVTVITHSQFGPLVRKMGFEHVDLNDAADYEATHDHPDVWHPTKGGARGARFFLRSNMRQQYAAIAERYVPGQTIVVAPNAGFGVRIAHDKLGIPFVSAHISPFFIPSADRPQKYPWWQPPDWAPRWVHYAYLWIGDVMIVDPLLAPEINRFRAELGLPPVKRILHPWNQSPQLILGLFPDWFSAPRPRDWPAHVVTTNFPFFDERDANELPGDMRDFLDRGEPPIVFTPGTGMRHAHSFFAAAVDACQRLGRRGLLLTRYPEQLPPNLPESVRHFAYAPFSLVLPRAAALVSHGGPGTVAQALRAGIPQLVMPLSHDQPDAARRLVRLGVGRVLWPTKFTGPAAARELEHLLKSAEVVARCRELAARFPTGETTPQIVDRLEEFADRQRT